MERFARSGNDYFSEMNERQENRAGWFVMTIGLCRWKKRGKTWTDPEMDEQLGDGHLLLAVEPLFSSVGHTMRVKVAAVSRKVVFDFRLRCCNWPPCKLAMYTLYTLDTLFRVIRDVVRPLASIYFL